ncbi:universal stress protein [Nocardioides panacihumi]|uniref:Universal stress protein n=1 Tax=Nocardioides panacihumi TaxID=400774 RepID=A0ABN2RTL4_9ACTN
MATNERPILVGVDGSSAATAAVRYAAVEADDLGVDLRLLHVIPTVAVGTLRRSVDSLDVIDVPRLQQRRDRMFGEAVALATSVLPSDRVTTHMVAGERVPTLLAAAEDARLVVLGAPWHRRLDRLITGSVVSGVSARAQVPVVGVPEGWTTAREHGRVVVGVRHPEDPVSVDLVRRALEIAAIRKCRLTVLHAWEFPVVYDNMIATTDDEQAWTDIRRGELDALVSMAGGPDPEVAIDFQVSHGQGAHLLVMASADADLLVITRREHGFPLGHLGSAGRAVLLASHCPVEVIPPGPVAGPDVPAGSAGD